MRYMHARVVAAFIVILLLSISGFAQQDKNQKKTFTSASLDGATGLFRTWDAETLRRGEFNFSLGYNYFNRDPGRLIFRDFPVAFGFLERRGDVRRHVRGRRRAVEGSDGAVRAVRG